MAAFAWTLILGRVHNASRDACHPTNILFKPAQTQILSRSNFVVLVVQSYKATQRNKAEGVLFTPLWIALYHTFTT